MMDKSGGNVAAETDKALTVHDLALLLNVTEKTIYRLAQKQALPGFKVAGAWRFMRHDIHRWVETQKTATTDSRMLSRRATDHP